MDELYRYLGIETSSQGMQRELYIKELESKIKNYETQINALKNCITMMQSVVAYG